MMKQIVQQRNWHQKTNDQAAQRAAAQDKLLILQGKMSYEKCVDWLERLGYAKVREEKWEKKKES